MIQNRSLEIEKAIEGARHAYEVANQKLEKAKDKLSRFEREKEALIKEADEDIKRFGEKSQKELGILLERIKTDNEQRIQEELKKAVEELKKISAKKIIASAEKIIKEKLSDTEEPFIESYVDSLQKGGPWQNGRPEHQNAMHEHS